MAAHERPIWILIGGCKPVALATLKKKRIPPGVTHWCHERDPSWALLTSGDRARLERYKRKASRSTVPPDIEGLS